MKRLLAVSLCFFLMITTQTVEARYQRGPGDDGYQGPRPLTSSQTNINGGCNCGTTIAGAATGGPGGPGGPEFGVGGPGDVDAANAAAQGGAASSSLLFNAALGTYVAYYIVEQNGEDEEIVETVYENVVAVVEIDKVGRDLYLYVTEVREADVESFITAQNQPDNIFQVISAENDGLTGEGISDLTQVIEFPPADTYNYVFFMEPGGSGATDITNLVAQFSNNEPE